MYCLPAFPNDSNEFQKTTSAMPQERQSSHSGLPNDSQGPANQRFVPTSSHTSGTGLRSNMASTVGCWVLQPFKRFIFRGSSSALHPYKVALALVTLNGLRRAGSSHSRSPARRLKERGLRLTNKKLPNSDIIDRPLELNVASGNESVNTRQLYEDQDLAESLMNDELLARSIHEGNVRAHSSDKRGLMLAVDLASDSIQDYITFTGQNSET